MPNDPERLLRREARATIRKELHRRKQDILQRTEFLVAALRAQCMTMIHELPDSVRKMTMREFCHIYGADTAEYLRQDAKRRMQRVIQEQHQPRQEKSQIHNEHPEKDKVHQDEQQQSTNDPFDPHDSKSISLGDDEDDFSIQLGQSQYQQKSVDESDPPLGPLFLHMDRQNHPRVRFQLDPLHTVDELGKFTFNIPYEIIPQMTTRQRSRICQQIEDIQDKLASVKSYFEHENQ
ncbi:hypothetical protein K492DRAFT_193409 [Lichtheimia hyalospora FSU 10163]|nr:hypothetical protein K492DRAFT_193409 [Lichtheimia hyalospora FSU 10163]